MPDLFKDTIPSILQTKKDVFEGEDYKSYVPFVINKALSAHYDCIFFVNEMNMKPFLPNKIQYQYYLNSIRAKKRAFQGWHKKEKLEEIELIKDYYNVSYYKAKQMIKLLSKANIETIRKALDEGGNRSE